MEWPRTHLPYLLALYPVLLVLNWPQGGYSLWQIPCGSPRVERRGCGERKGGGEGGLSKGGVKWSYVLHRWGRGEGGSHKG